MTDYINADTITAKLEAAVARMETHVLTQINLVREEAKQRHDELQEKVQTLFMRSEEAGNTARQEAQAASHRLTELDRRVAKIETRVEDNRSDIDAVADGIREREARNRGRLDAARVFQAMVAGGALAGVSKALEVLL